MVTQKSKAGGRGSNMAESIKGKVRDANGNPVAGAQVTATNANNVAAPAVATDAQGDYTIPNLAAGAYTVSVQAPGGGANPPPLANVNVAAGQATGNQNFQLPAGAAQTGSIAGRVTNAQGAVVAGAQVTATAANNVAAPAVATDAQGDYTIPNLAAGAYTVSVQAPGGGANPPPLANVNVAAGQATGNQNFQLPAGAAQTGSIAGRVTNAQGAVVAGVTVTAVPAAGAAIPSIQTNQQGDYNLQNVPAGVYTVEAAFPNNGPKIVARGVSVFDGQQTTGMDFSEDPVSHLVGILDDGRFDIETPINRDEAEFAATFFHIANVVLAGLTENNGQSDVFGSQKVASSADKLGIVQTSPVWGETLREAEKLKEEWAKLATSQSVERLKMEMKRHFNLGTTNNVLANVQFPGLMRRYAEIALDPLLTIDLEQEDNNPNSNVDKTRIAQADDLLKELKGVILQLVRGLSRSGSIQTKIDNEKWAPIAVRGLEIVGGLAQARATGDDDDKSPWAVVAVLTEKNRDTQVAPHIVLGRHGGRLLNLAIKVYDKVRTVGKLEDFDKRHLRIVFQDPAGRNPGGSRGFFTDRMREEATYIRRYPLLNWG